MANRFSPSVLPQAGPEFDPAAVARALEMFQADREHSADRKTAQQDRARQIALEEEEQEYLRAQRELEAEEQGRAKDVQAAADYDAGFRPKGTSTMLEREIGAPEVTGGGSKRPQAGPMVGVNQPQPQTPFSQRIQETRMAMEDPTAAAMPTRKRLPGQLDSKRQSFREQGGSSEEMAQSSPDGGRSFQDALMEETANYQALPSGGHRDLGATPEARALEQEQQLAQRAGQVGAGLGADAGLQDFFRFDPEALGDYVDNRYTTDRNRETAEAAMARTLATNRAANERARMTNDRLSGSGGDGSAASTGLTPSQAFTQARQIISGATENRTPGQIAEMTQIVAEELLRGGDVEYALALWEQNNLATDVTDVPPIGGFTEVPERGFSFPSTRATAPVGRSSRLSAGLAQEADAAAGGTSGFDVEEARSLAEGFSDQALLGMGFTDEQLAQMRGET